MARADSGVSLTKRPSTNNGPTRPPAPSPSMSRSSDWQILRVNYIPYTATIASLPKYFGEQDRPRIKVVSLVASIGSKKSEEEDPRQTAILSYAPKTSGSLYPRPIDEKVRSDTVQLDTDFVGFTPLSYFRDAAVDVIFFPAIGSHPYLAWAEGNVANGDCWPLNNLPQAVPRGRVLLYGYNPEDYEETETNISNKAETFLRRLRRLRQGEGNEDRPIVYVAHCTGCLVLKQVLIDSSSDVENDLIKAVVFLGAPHDGLSRKSCSLIYEGEMQSNLANELSLGSPTILDLNADFAPVADRLHIVACYETRETSTDQGWPEVLVPMDTATLFKSTTIAVDAEHRGLAQAQKREAGMFDDIVGSIKDAVNQVTKPAGWRAQSFSVGGPASPVIAEAPEDDPFSSSFKSGNLAPSSVNSQKQGNHLERVHTASSDISSKAMNLSSAFRSRKKSVPWLHARNASFEPPPKDLFALHQALRNQDFPAAHSLVEKFVEYDLKDPENDNRTALHEAAIVGDLEIIRALLEAGAMVEPRTRLTFRTPMHYAALQGHEHIIKMLLEYGAKVDSRSAEESTALHYAAERGHLGLVKLLIDKEAGVNLIRGRVGKTPLDLSRDHAHPDVATYLWSKGGRPNPNKDRKAAEHAYLF